MEPVSNLSDGGKNISVVLRYDGRSLSAFPWMWCPVKRRMLPGCELFADGDAFTALSQRPACPDYQEVDEFRDQ